MSVAALIRSLFGRADVVRVRSALNPALWLAVTIVPTCLFFAWLLGGDPILRYGLSALAGLLVLVAAMAYVYFMLVSPDRLQSEEYVLRQRELTIIERKQAGPIQIEGTVTVDDAHLIEGGKESDAE